MSPTRKSVAEMSAVLVRVSGNVARAGRPRAGAARLALLRAIAEASEPRPPELATHLALSRAAVTRQLQELSADGLVELTIDENDRRSFFVSLTDEGRARLAALTERGLQRFELFTADWSDEDVKETRPAAHPARIIDRARRPARRTDRRPTVATTPTRARLPLDRPLSCVSKPSGPATPAPTSRNVAPPGR